MKHTLHRMNCSDGDYYIIRNDKRIILQSGYFSVEDSKEFDKEYEMISEMIDNWNYIINGMVVKKEDSDRIFLTWRVSHAFKEINRLNANMVEKGKEAYIHNFEDTPDKVKKLIKGF